MTDSPYARSADTLRDNGYHVMPVVPGEKVPGAYYPTGWHRMGQWQKWCDSQPPSFLHDKWRDWPDAGICVAHGLLVGLDIDTDRTDVAEAAVVAVGASPARRRGRKGWMGYYRPGPDLGPHAARVRWYDGDGTICVELLLHGTQSVLPPTIHPETGQPYTWVGEDSLEELMIEELPELPADPVARLDEAFAALGLTRKAPRRVNGKDYGDARPAERAVATDHDLEKPFGRSLNDRAMEPEALDQWWPALDLPKSRQRGRSGAWEAVPFWRVSNSGRAVQDRNPNLKVVPSGIVDFGADRSYTPIDVVMAARDCSFHAAAEWLQDFVRPEEGNDITLTTPEAECGQIERISAYPGKNLLLPIEAHRWQATPVFPGSRSRGPIKPVALPSEAEWDAMMPKEPPPFPVQDWSALEGLLGEVVTHIDAASATFTEAGALAVALPLLGAAMGRAYATPTNLRTNIYTVALGGSGTGKTSLVNPAKELLMHAQLADIIGTDRIKSGSGLIQLLTAGPRRVCFLDEFGHMLQQIGSPGAGVHSREILTEFTMLYSSAGSLFTGTAYASREPSPIDCPHLCLFGMATPDQFWRAFGSSSLEDGSIARYLVFPLGQTTPKVPNGSRAESVGREIAALQGYIRASVTGNLGQPGVVTVPLNEHAEAERAALKDKETAFAEYAEKNGVRGGPAIIRRVTENALKIALVSAVSRKPDRPEIDQRDMQIGHAIAWWTANVMISNIASHIADNQIERDVNDVERFIVQAGDHGRPWRTLQRNFRRIRQRDLKEILEGLTREGSIEEIIEQSPYGGHPKKTYRVSR